VSIRVVIADDQGMMREGLKALLDAEPDIDVVGEATDGHDALAVIERTNPDVALMDIRMPRLDGLEATRRLVGRGNGTRVLILTTFDLDEYVFESLRCGAGGFLLKDASAGELAEAVRALARGDGTLSPSVTRRVIEAFASVPAPGARAAELDALSAREVEVLRLLARGLLNAEIAEALVVSLATAKTHVASILLKLGLRDRVQAAIFAYESGLVRPGDASA
jgi:DNA-binding NarL/FixJ family response regulator